MMYPTHPEWGPDRNNPDSPDSRFAIAEAYEAAAMQRPRPDDN